MIQSAEEFINEIINEHDDYETRQPGSTVIELLSSRDKAIIDRCKEKMREVLGFDPEEVEADELLALDSVLRELSE